MGASNKRMDEDGENCRRFAMAVLPARHPFVGRRRLMKDHERQMLRWFGMLAGLTLVIFVPVIWMGYLRPAIELGRVVSATDNGAALDVPVSFSASVDALVESTIAKHHRGGENIRVVLVRNRDRLLLFGMLLAAATIVLLITEFVALDKAGRMRIPTSPCT